MLGTSTFRMFFFRVKWKRRKLSETEKDEVFGAISNWSVRNRGEVCRCVNVRRKKRGALETFAIKISVSHAITGRLIRRNETRACLSGAKKTLLVLSAGLGAGDASPSEISGALWLRARAHSPSQRGAAVFWLYNFWYPFDGSETAKPPRIFVHSGSNEFANYPRITGGSVLIFNCSRFIGTRSEDFGEPSPRRKTNVRPTIIPSSAMLRYVPSIDTRSLRFVEKTKIGNFFFLTK